MIISLLDYQRRCHQRPKPVRATGMRVDREENWAYVQVATNVDDDDLERINYFWYREGAFAGHSLEPRRAFRVRDGEQLEITALASRWRSYPADGLVLNDAAPGTRELEWIRCDDDDTSHYICEYREGGAGDWTQFRVVKHIAGKWGYRVRTPVLPAGDYELRVTPVDLSGNEGTMTTIDIGQVLGRPEAVDAEITWDSGTGKVTIAEAS